ncbi:MAG TPA: hypothetical protein VNG94_05110, partial [Pyrinomonadaceae bacterium]|nr:hypothetical protein [Pyrinomonadaceae bacterium]
TKKAQGFGDNSISFSLRNLGVLGVSAVRLGLPSPQRRRDRRERAEHLNSGPTNVHNRDSMG